jgi:hypothetical protein
MKLYVICTLVFIFLYLVLKIVVIQQNRNEERRNSIFNAANSKIIVLKISK